MEYESRIDRMTERQKPQEVPMPNADSTQPSTHLSPSARRFPDASFTPEEQNLTREQKDLLRLIQRTPINLQKTGGANNASSRRRSRFS